MTTVLIKNPDIDPAGKALVEQAFAAITSQWQNLLPPITVTFSRKPLSKAKELKEYWAAQSLPKSQQRYVQVACPEFDKDGATLWVRYNHASVMTPPDYYFKKELYSVVAQLIWGLSDHLRKVVATHATGMAEGNEAAQYMGFRDSFSRLFLNPKWLAERKPAAWSFINRVDQVLKPKKAA